jgi:hypothetical protein
MRVKRSNSVFRFARNAALPLSVENNRFENKKANVTQGGRSAAIFKKQGHAPFMVAG